MIFKGYSPFKHVKLDNNVANELTLSQFSEYFYIYSSTNRNTFLK